jgi:hypothetical protein
MEASPFGARGLMPLEGFVRLIELLNGCQECCAFLGVPADCFAILQGFDELLRNSPTAQLRCAGGRAGKTRVQAVRCPLRGSTLACRTRGVL